MGIIEKKLSRQEKLIVTVSVLLITISLLGNKYLPDIMGGLRPQNRNFIGLVINAEGDVRMRFGDSINWLNLTTKDKIYSQTYLFTGKNSSAIYAFLDESSISIGENSLIFMDFITDPTIRTSEEKDSASIAVNLVEGKMQINLKEESPVKMIKVDQTLINTGKDSTLIQLNYEKQGMDISVIEGDINIVQNNTTYNVKPGEKLDIENKDATPEIKRVDQKTMDEIMRIAKEDQKKALKEIIEKRQLGNIINDLVHGLIGN